MSLILTSLGVMGGLFLGRAVARALRRERTQPEGASGKGPRPDSPRATASAPQSAGPGVSHASLAGFPCRLGDVILAFGDEAWLAGAIIFHEKTPMAVLFIAPDAGGDRAVYARQAPETSLAWLSPVAAGTLVVGREPPSALELDQERFERRRRLPYRAERAGTGAPDLGDAVVVAEYGSATGECLLVVSGASSSTAWRGRVLDEGAYEILPGSEP